jgi:hypothetical protein
MPTNSGCQPTSPMSQLRHAGRPVDALRNTQCVNSDRNTVTVSLRAYARHRGVSATSVHRAVRSGRLSTSVTWLNGGQPGINVALADREWPALPDRPGVSLRAYARHRNVSATLVHRAVHRGRLSTSVEWQDGVPRISDVSLADREWAAKQTPHSRSFS